MKKILLYFSLFILHISLCSAQDTIVLRTGIKTGVKVISVGDFVVFNQPPNDQNQRMENSKIAYIKYADGSIYTVNRPEIGPTPKSEIYQYNDSAYTLFSITTDLAQYSLLQPNLGFELRADELITFGVNFGLVEPSPMFALNPLTDYQFTNPGTVYKGYALRLYVKLFSSRNRGYFAIQGVLKSLSFNNITFNSDSYGDQDVSFISTNTYTMSERTTTLGLELLHGNDLLGPTTHFDIDIFYGIGIHFRYRNYTISNQSWDMYGPPTAQYSGNPIALDGTYSNVLKLFTPVFGFRAGFNYIRKK